MTWFYDFKLNILLKHNNLINKKFKHDVCVLKKWILRLFYDSFFHIFADRTSINAIKSLFFDQCFKQLMDMSIYLTAPLQLDKICRACLTEKGDMRPLFGACLDEMLVSFASIQVRYSADYLRKKRTIRNACFRSTKMMDCPI